MRLPILLLVLAAALVPWGLLAQDKPKDVVPAEAPARAVGDTEDVVFFGDTRPVLIRLYVLMDGKPYRAAFDDFIKELVKFLDRDEDGVLSKAEAENIPSPQILFSGGFVGFQQGGVFNARGLDANEDGKISSEELVAYYRQNGINPFQVTFGAGQNPLADAMTDLLFTKLDSNKDGKLSKEELTSLGPALLKLDQDEDELVSTQELAPGGNPNAFGGGGVIVRQPQQQAPTQPPANAAFVPLTGNDSPRRIVNDILSRYSKGQEDQPIRRKRVTREDLGLDKADFARLDGDKNDLLDADELERFASRGADIELVIRLGKLGQGEQAVDVFTSRLREAPLNSQVRKANDGVVLDLGNSQIELRRNEGAAQQQRAFDVRQVYGQQFKAADTDNNGYLDAKETQQNRVFTDLFKQADRDGDGMLFEKELIAYVEKNMEFQAKATAARTSLSISDKGRGLYDMLDANRDSRLGLRELREAAKALLAMDRDSDGQLARSEIPRHYQLALGRGLPGNQYAGQQVFVIDSSGRYVAQPQAPVNEAGPLWFRKMDRNRDGDLSPREFLGDQDDFQRLDTDSDGLISLEEAQRMDAALRK